MPDAPPQHFRDRWLRECRHKAELAANAGTPEDQARLCAEARQNMKNAREWQRRVMGRQ